MSNPTPGSEASGAGVHQGAPTGAPPLPARFCAPLLLACARGWEPEVRLLGNVRAKDIAALCESVIQPSPASETATPEPSVTTDAETVEELTHKLSCNQCGRAVGEANYSLLVYCSVECEAAWHREHAAPESSPAVDAGTTDAPTVEFPAGDGGWEETPRIDDAELVELVTQALTDPNMNPDDVTADALALDLRDARIEMARLRATRSPAVDDETPKLLAQVAKAAAAFCAELQEDGEGVPQPELRALHAALDAVDLAKLEADWLTHLAVCYRCNEDHRDPCDIGARIRAEMDALDERIDSAAARRSPESVPEANNG